MQRMSTTKPRSVIYNVHEMCLCEQSDDFFVFGEPSKVEGRVSVLVLRRESVTQKHHSGRYSSRRTGMDLSAPAASNALTAMT